MSVPNVGRDAKRPGSTRRGLAVHLYPSSMAFQSRMLRVTETVARLGIFEQVLLVGVAEPGLPETERVDADRQIVRVPRPFNPPSGLAQRIINTQAWCRRIWTSFKGRHVDCVNAHSLSVLPLAVRLKRRHGAVLVYEPHELETETSESTGLRRWLAKRTERRLIHEADEVVAVNQSIADWYSREYKLTNVRVFRNIPDAKMTPGNGPALLRRLCGLPDDALVFLYLGNLTRHRRIEQYLRVFAQLPDRHLVFMGFGSHRSLIADASRRHKNIHLLPPVQPTDVLTYASGADVGLCGVDPKCLSYQLSLPNKFFEYLLSGVPVLAPDLPETKLLMDGKGCGWVVADGSDQAYLETIAGIDRPAVEHARARTADALGGLSFAREAALMSDVYRRLFAA
jgi:glycosyltransferase involved in cell wall biosynthesis